jgi:thiamine biosynthesis lipoprotein
MGTVLQVTVVAPDEDRARRLAENALELAGKWDDVLTIWRPEGELARLNRAAGRGPQLVSADLRAALEAMLALSRSTNGAFNPAVGSWVDRWRTPGADSLPASTVPPLAQVLRLEPAGAVLASGISLDPGAIGKGIAVAAVVSMLEAGGASAAFIDFGGSSLYGLGAPPEDPAGWTVAVSGLGPQEVLGTLRLRDSSLSTSQASGPGSAAGPIVDPSTGKPAETPRLAVVLAPKGEVADGWSTALIVLGRAGLDRARQHRLAALVQDPAGVAMTPEMAAALGR